MSRLISITDFVLNGMQTADYIKLYDGCRNYANFLKQPLTLGMFVPCDLDGNVLKIIPLNEHKQGSIFEFIQHKLFEEAKERVLFEGIEYVEEKHKRSHSIVRICKSLSTINYPDFWKNKTIEDLIPYNLRLTPTALKQIGL